MENTELNTSTWMPLQDAVDLHIHIGPDTVQRYCDCIELAREAAQKGMRALVLKDQMCPSVHKALLTSKIVPEVKVFGGIVLNHTNGGLNPRSVIVAMKTGGKIIWLPTVDAKWCIEKGRSGHWIETVNIRNSFGYTQDGISLVSNGKVVPEVEDILKIAAEYDAIVATGHVSPEECMAVVEANAKIGAKVLVTHPNLWFDDFNVDVLKVLVQGGAVIEFTFGGLTPLRGRGNPVEMAEVIEYLGYKNCCLSTDLGAIDNCSPPEGLRSFAYVLNRCGLSKEAIEYMIKTKPAELLCLGTRSASSDLAL